MEVDDDNMGENATKCNERKNRVKQFKRIVMSFADFKEAVDLSEYLISNALHDDFDKNKLLITALNSSMIIAYCRPFSGNDSRNVNKIPDLGNKALRELNLDELALHELIMNDRNKLLAHSDSEAVNLKFIINKIDRFTLLQPIRNWSAAPLSKEHLNLFNKIAHKLLAYVAKQRHAQEDEIIPLFEASDFCAKEETEVYGLNPK